MIYAIVMACQVYKDGFCFLHTHSNYLDARFWVNSFCVLTYSDLGTYMCTRFNHIKLFERRLVGIGFNKYLIKFYT